MCNSIFIGCFCVVFHCNTYELYRLFSVQIVIHIGLLLLYVTGFRKTDPNCTFGIWKITNLKYSTHCESLLLGCSHAKFTLQLATIVI